VVSFIQLEKKMMRNLLGKKLSMFLFLGLSSSALSKQLVCHHYVMANYEFCSVTLNVLEDGKIASPVSINHQGQTYSSLIEEVSLGAGEKFHLFLDVDKPGQELEMIIKETQNDKGEYPAILINPQAPFAKEMQGKCQQTR
jgi:hypothetical protein